MGFKAIVFDFDGVILESVDIKTSAFRRLFNIYPDHVDRIVQFHVDNTGISRFEKFKVIHRDFLKLALSEEEEKRLGQEFAGLVLEEVLRSPFVPGAREFLEKYAPSHELFLASATPGEELRTIVAARGLAGFFQQTYGYPPVKATILRGLLMTHGWSAQDILFVGDAINDHAASIESGVPFVGRVRAGTVNVFPPETPVIQDLIELDQMWPAFSAGLNAGQSQAYPERGANGL